MENIEVHTDIKRGDVKVGKFWFSLQREEFKELISLLYDFSNKIKVGTVGFKDVNGNYNKNFTLIEELF